MSFNFYLYRAAEGLPPMNEWEALHAERLGDSRQLRQALDALFPGLQWRAGERAWNGTGAEPGGRPMDIWLSLGDDDGVHFVVMNKASPSAMRKVLEALDLNYVAAPEAGDLVDVYAYQDSDLHYARKEYQ